MANVAWLLREQQNCWGTESIIYASPRQIKLFRSPRSRAARALECGQRFGNLLDRQGRQAFIVVGCETEYFSTLRYENKRGAPTSSRKPKLHRGWARWS